MLTKELCDELFYYRGGELFWKINAANNVKIGYKAGCIDSKNYGVIRIKNKGYKTHRIIFLMHHGYLPKIIDHIDRNSLNNNIDNLRPATHYQNMINSKIPKNNTSKYKNVFFEQKKWRVRIRIDGKPKDFGSYFDKEVARFVAEAMRNKYHKEFSA